MRYLALYLLLGAMVAVWTAINARRTAAAPRPGEPRPNLASMLPAYAIVALAWPLSLLLFVLALVAGFSDRAKREGPERPR
jgi:hypothetical protein